uniref:Uncharacterized protein n=1 Tax=Oryza meridionalis TaxID=40149 RepID=A0A0E0D6C9_9ORYZ
MAAIRLAARRLGAGTLRRPRWVGYSHRLLRRSNGGCCHGLRRRLPWASQKCVTNIEEKKEELFHMLAQLDIDYPSNSKYARDSRKLLYMLVEQLRDTEIHDPLWPMYERRKVLYDRLKIEALPNSAAFSSYSEKL